MSMNAVLFRAAVLMVVVFVLAVTATHRPAVAQAQTSVAHAATPAIAADSRPVVELPTITIRPSAADLIAAQDEAATPSGGGGNLIEASAASDALYDSLAPNMPSLRMDVPYYSFGKALRRGAKE